MKKIEILRIAGLNKLSFILNVLKSCKTVEQINNTYNWGFSVLDQHFRRNYSDSMCEYYDKREHFGNSICLLKERFKNKTNEIIESQKQSKQLL